MSNAKIDQLKQVADDANEEMNDAALARTIAAGHKSETSQQAARIRAAIASVAAAEMQRKAAWRTLEEVLDRFPEAAGKCREELAGLQAELAQIGG